MNLFPLPPLHRPTGLHDDACQDEKDADIKGEVHLTPFPEKDEGDDDGIYGLQVVGKVDGKGGELFQTEELEHILSYRAEQGEAQQVDQVLCIRNRGHSRL